MMNPELTKYVRDWFARADEDLDIAQLILEEERPYNPACFHAQQAAEKYLKGFLAHHEKHVRKIHDLNALLQECIKIDQSFDGLQNSVNYLGRFYVESRYPDDYVEFTREDVEKGFEAALRVKKFILEKIKLKQKNGFGIVGIIIIVAVAVLGGGFLYWRNAQWLSGCPMIAKICPDGSTVGYIWPTCKLAECPGGRESRAETADTSTWKTYRNEKYGFEIKHPKDTTVNFEEGPVLGGWQFSVYNPVYAKMISDKVPSFGISNRSHVDYTKMSRIFREEDIGIITTDTASIYFIEKEMPLYADCIRFNDFKTKSSYGLPLCNQILSAFKFIK